MISSGKTTIGTAASLVDGTSNSSFRLVIQNNDNTDSVYIGGSAVGTATGLTLQKLETLDLLLPAGAELYAIATKAGHPISWLKIT